MTEAAWDTSDFISKLIASVRSPPSQQDAGLANLSKPGHVVRSTGLFFFLSLCTASAFPCVTPLLAQLICEKSSRQPPEGMQAQVFTLAHPAMLRRRIISAASYQDHNNSPLSSVRRPLPPSRLLVPTRSAWFP